MAQILRTALAPKPAIDPKAVLFEMPDVGEDSDFERARDLPPPVEIAAVLLNPFSS